MKNGQFRLFESYEELPQWAVEHIQTVIGLNLPIENFPLWEINDYFLGLEEFMNRTDYADFHSGQVKAQETFEQDTRA